jgi:putative FmdB family regulatory protein
MPIFDLRCNNCDEVIENVLLKFNADTPICNCGGTTKRLISTPSFMFAQPAGTDGGRLMQIAKKTKRT